MISEKSDNQLMNDFSKCSIDAYTEIFNRYQKRLLNFVLRGLIKDVDMSEDIVQKTLIKVYENKHIYTPSHQFSTWIYTIARNLSLNEIKRVKNINSHQVSYEEAGALENGNNLESTVENSNINEIFLNIIKMLDNKYREVLTMRYIEELSYDEISKITDIKVNTLKSHSKRGLKQIERVLKDKNIEFE